MSCFFYYDLTLNWTNAYEVYGVGEPIIYTRRQAIDKNKKQPSSGTIVIGSFHASKNARGATSTPTRSDIGKIQIGAKYDSEFEKLLNFDKSFFRRGGRILNNMEDHT